MKTGKLTLEALANGLAQFQDKYQALDVFIQDVPELEQYQGDRFSVGVAGQELTIELYRELGVARVMRKQNGGSTAFAGALAGAAAGVAMAKPSGRGEAAVVGFLAGMLVGAILGDSEKGARRILAVRYDPATKRWMGYDGGLVPYMKQRLAHPRVIGDLPKKMEPRPRPA